MGAHLRMLYERAHRRQVGGFECIVMKYFWLYIVYNCSRISYSEE